MDKQKESEQLNELLAAYGDKESIQNFQAAATDNQLKSLAMITEDLLHNCPQGTVLDIGCGNGIFLAKLADLHSFCSNTKWNYLGADQSFLLDPILQLAAKLHFHRRCEVIDIDLLYESWIQSVSTPYPLLIVLRNVLHELDIQNTAKLFHLLNEWLKPEDTLLIQDFLVFPSVERGNVCWDSVCLLHVFEQLGFDASVVEEPSRSGAQWFSSKIKKNPHAKRLTIDEVLTIVADGRKAQLEKWRTADTIPLKHPDSRAVKVAIMDFDLQKVALYQQIDAAGFFSPAQKANKLVPDPKMAMQLILSSYDSTILDRTQFKMPVNNNFRDRKNSQDALEIFLRSKDSVVVIQGGISCGKSVLVSQVLSRRAHNRSVVPIDCNAADDIWPILEQYLLAIGCRSSLEILSREKNLQFKAIQDTIETLIISISKKVVVVFDHFEKLIDPNGLVMDSEIQQFLTILSSADGAKIIITTRKEPILNFLPPSVVVNTDQPPVGRFPNGPHIENLLDDYVDRTLVGLEHYPTELIEAIDRFPYLAVLAGKLIAESGSAVANDPEILKIIKSYLYDELAKRIVTKEAEPALRLACQLRIPAPRILFEGIVGTNATNAAVETGLLFLMPDRYRDDLLACASVLRSNESEFDAVDDDASMLVTPDEMHEKIAKWYTNISQCSTDPRWIREAHHHILASGNNIKIDNFGGLYKGELFWAARTWFRRFHNYGNALEALQAAEGMGLQTYETRLLLAACLVRTGQRKDGESRYRALISEFPNQEGVKTSFVDSLLKINEFEDALGALNEFSLSMTGSNPWVAGQYGRAYLGLHDYGNAIEAFDIQRHKYSDPPPIIYVRLAQSYFRLGERVKAREIISEGLSVHNDDLAISTLYCANLIHNGSPSELQEAERRLNDLANISPRNGYILQKLVTVGALQGDPSPAINRIERINWQIDPPRLEKPVKIAVYLAQRHFRKALEIADSLSSMDEYGQAIMRKIFLIWAGSEPNAKNKQHIAQKGLEREIPSSCQNNIPILAMYAQLARIANDNTRFDQTLALIRKYHSLTAENILGIDNPYDRWDDYEPELV